MVELQKYVEDRLSCMGERMERTRVLEAIRAARTAQEPARSVPMLSLARALSCITANLLAAFAFAGNTVPRSGNQLRKEDTAARASAHVTRAINRANEPRRCEATINFRSFQSATLSVLWTPDVDLLIGREQKKRCTFL